MTAPEFTLDGRPFDGLIDVNVIDIHARLRFIEELMTRHAFEGCAILRDIRDDYRRTKKKLLEEEVLNENCE